MIPYFKVNIFYWGSFKLDWDPDTGYNFDPDTGYNIDPDTGYNIDPDTGYNIDPDTGYNIDPDTGYNIDLDTGYKIDPELPLCWDRQLLFTNIRTPTPSHRDQRLTIAKYRCMDISLFLFMSSYET